MRQLCESRLLKENRLSFPFMMAPMVGLSHVAFRSVVRDYLPANVTTIWPTEMLNSRRLPSQNVGQTPETLKEINENNIVPQILGNEEHFIAESVKRLETWGATGIDINMGCPVKKALKHNYGVALMGDPLYAKSVVEMTVRNTRLPVSVKIRAGETGDFNILNNFCQEVIASGVKSICLHPRTSSQKRKGNADWNQIKLLREKVDVPIIGNGDIHTFKDALRMWEETLCDGVMVGRALTSRPWMFWQIGESFGLEAPAGKEGQKAPQTGEEEAYEYGVCLLKFIEKCEEHFEVKYGIRKIKFYLKVSHPWLNFGHRLVSLFTHVNCYEHAKDVVKEFFLKDGLFMSSHTILNY